MQQTTSNSKYCSLLPKVAKVVELIGYNKRGITYLLYKTINYTEEYMCTYKTSTSEKQEHNNIHNYLRILELLQALQGFL